MKPVLGSSEILEQRSLLAAFAGQTSGIFDFPEPADATVTGVGTSNFTFGMADTADGFTQPNSFQFAGNAISGDQEQVFSLGTLTYYNGTTLGGVDATGVDLEVTATLSNPAGGGSRVFTYPLTMVSTPNTGTVLENRDYVYLTLPDYPEQTFTTANGDKLTLAILGFGTVTGDGGIGTTAQTINEFLVDEGASASAQLLGEFVNPVGLLPDIAVTGAALSANDQSVNASYTITGSDLKAASTIGFYWATGPTFADRIGTTPATTVPTATKSSPGTYSISTSLASLGNRPANATTIIAVADSPDLAPDHNPDGLIEESNETNNVAATAAPMTDIQMIGAQFTTDSSVDFTYGVTGNPGSVLFGLYRSKTEQFDPNTAVPLDGQFIDVTANASGKGTFQLSGPLPYDADYPYILAVADPLNAIVESDESNNVTATKIPLPDIQMVGAQFTSDSSITFTYGVSGNPGSVLFGLYRSKTEQFDPNTAVPLDGQTVNVPADASGMGTFSLSEALPNDPAYPYVLAVADPLNAINESDESNNVVPITLPDLAATSLMWDDLYGGFDFGYTLTGYLSNDTPVDFYWSANPTANPETDTLAAASYIRSEQSSSSIYVNASSIAAPSADSKYLVAIIDPDNTTTESDKNNNTISLAYDPEITVTATYNGSTDPNTIGRFLAIPGLVDETFIAQLSESLAALRPSVSLQIGSDFTLPEHPATNSDGSWDGFSYETAGFDPGLLSGSTTLTTTALETSTDLKDVQTTLDVQPLPDWYNDLQSTVTKPSFTPMPGGPSGSLTGYYTLSGSTAFFQEPSVATLPKKYPLIGGKQIGASIDFGLSLTIPLNNTSSPIASGFAAEKITFLGTDVFDTNTVIDQRLSDALTVTPNIVLDPETLQAEGGFGATFKFHDNYSTGDRPFFSGSVPVEFFLLNYNLSADISFDLSAAATIVLTPNVGFSVVPETSFVQVGLEATLKGDIDAGYNLINKKTFSSLKKKFPKIFRNFKSLPELSLDVEVGGTAELNARVNYSGNTNAVVPLAVTYEVIVSPIVTTQLVFTVGGDNLLGQKPFDLAPYFFPKAPYKYKF